MIKHIPQNYIYHISQPYYSIIHKIAHHILQLVLKKGWIKSEECSFWACQRRTVRHTTNRLLHLKESKQEFKTMGKLQCKRMGWIFKIHLTRHSLL